MESPSREPRLSEKEIWKPVKDFPEYEISNYGRLKSLARYGEHGRWLKERFIGSKRTPRSVVCLRKNNRTLRRTEVGILVLEHFVGPKPLGKMALHYDDNPQHNHLTNLYWGTYAENVKDAKRNGRWVDPPKAKKGQKKPLGYGERKSKALKEWWAKQTPEYKQANSNRLLSTVTSARPLLMSERMTGAFWINNGVSETHLKRGDLVPVGWAVGRIYKGSDTFIYSTSGTKWVYNGLKQCRIPNSEQVPIGWKLGRRKRSRVYLDA